MKNLQQGIYSVFIMCILVSNISAQNITESFPWLSNFVVEDECTLANVTVYDFTAYAFVEIEDPEKVEIYFQDGQLFCTNRNGLDCREAYALTEDKISFQCKTDKTDGTDEPNAITDQYPWLLNLIDDCSRLQGEIFEIGATTFIVISFIDSDMRKTMYNVDGLRWCTFSAGLDCAGFYDLTNDNLVNTFSLECDSAEEPMDENICTGNSTFAIGNSIKVADLIDFENNIFSEDQVFNVKVYDDRRNLLRELSIEFQNRFVFTLPISKVGTYSYEFKSDELDCEGSIMYTDLDLTCAESVTVYGVADLDQLTFGDFILNLDSLFTQSELLGFTTPTDNTFAIRLYPEDNPAKEFVNRIYDFPENPIVDYSIGIFGSEKTCQGSLNYFTDGESLLLLYPWLDELVNIDNCENEQLISYELPTGDVVIVFISDGNEKVFDQDGNILCESSAVNTCQEVYENGIQQLSWGCNGFFVDNQNISGDYIIDYILYETCQFSSDSTDIVLDFRESTDQCGIVQDINVCIEGDLTIAQDGRFDLNVEHTRIEGSTLFATNFSESSRLKVINGEVYYDFFGRDVIADFSQDDTHIFLDFDIETCVFVIGARKR